MKFRALLSSIAVTGLVAGAIMVSAAPANAIVYTFGTIEGDVTFADPSVDPTAFDIYFFLEAGTYPYDPVYDSVNQVVSPDSSAHFVSPSLRTGRYLVYVTTDDSVYKEVYPKFYYPNAKADFTATWVIVVDGGVATADLAPQVGGYIQVNVTFSGTSTNPGIQWPTYDSTGSVPLGGPTGEHSRRLTYDPDTGGIWLVGPIAAGTYRLSGIAASVETTPGHIWREQYWDHKSALLNSSTITVVAAATTTGVSMDFVISPAATISGTVTDSHGNPVMGAIVGAESTTGEVGWTSISDASGHYTVQYLGAGDYTVYAAVLPPWPGRTTQYGYYPNVTDYDSATLVTLASDSTSATGVNIQMSDGLAPEAVWDLTRYQVSLPPPASTTAELLALLTDRSISTESLSDWGATYLNGIVSFEDLPWSGARDSFVDVFVYSSPQQLGSFPVIGDKLSAAVSLSGLSAGHHTLVLVGRDSGDIKVADVTVAGPLAATGSSAAPVAPLGVALLMLGLVALIVVRRRRPTAAD